jgi:hypothetical protein
MDDTFRASLPDMSDPALWERLNLGGHSITVQVSPVRTYEDYGPSFDVVHVCARRADGAPLALRDIQPNASREAAYDLWSFLCEQLRAAAILVYGLRDAGDGQPNPRLGCWGPRPDLVLGADDDGATVLVIGVAIDKRAAATPERGRLLVLALRSALVAALRRWTGGTNVPADLSARLN